MATARSCGVGARFARNELEELTERFLPALSGAIEAVAKEGFPVAVDVGKRIGAGFKERRAKLR